MYAASLAGPEISWMNLLLILLEMIQERCSSDNSRVVQIVAQKLSPGWALPERRPVVRTVASPRRFAGPEF